MRPAPAGGRHFALAHNVAAAATISGVQRPLSGAMYDHFGWRIAAAPIDVAEGRLAETHEYFHRQLDDTTAFGGLITTVAALADALPASRWHELRQRLLDVSDLVHESFAVALSLVT